MTMTLDTVTLPLGLLWADEYNWHAVGQKSAYTLTGALVVESAGKQAGRHITLAGGEDYGWVQRATLDALYALAAIPGKVMTLTLPDARTYQVMFRHHDEGAISAEALLQKCIQAADDYYVVTIYLMAV